MCIITLQYGHILFFFIITCSMQIGRQVCTQCSMYTLYTHGIVCSLYMVDTLELGTAPPAENPA